jgi:hypothetical protein
VKKVKVRYFKETTPSPSLKRRGEGRCFFLKKEGRREIFLP